MKKGLLKWLAVMMMAMLCIPQVFALSEIRVRVNGAQVYFPDGKPYVDNNSRVLVPVGANMMNGIELTSAIMSKVK